MRTGVSNVSKSKKRSKKRDSAKKSRRQVGSCIESDSKSMITCGGGEIPKQTVYFCPEEHNIDTSYPMLLPLITEPRPEGHGADGKFRIGRATYETVYTMDKEYQISTHYFLVEEADPIPAAKSPEKFLNTTLVGDKSAADTSGVGEVPKQTVYVCLEENNIDTNYPMLLPLITEPRPEGHGADGRFREGAATYETFYAMDKEYQITTYYPKDEEADASCYKVTEKDMETPEAFWALFMRWWNYYEKEPHCSDEMMKVKFKNFQIHARYLYDFNKPSKSRHQHAKYWLHEYADKPTKEYWPVIPFSKSMLA